jgi:thiosulfate reductase cytochrome b subunit
MIDFPVVVIRNSRGSTAPCAGSTISKPCASRPGRIVLTEEAPTGQWKLMPRVVLEPQIYKRDKRDGRSCIQSRSDVSCQSGRTVVIVIRANARSPATQPGTVCKTPHSPPLSLRVPFIEHNGRAMGTIPQMADSIAGRTSAPATTLRPRHPAVVRVTHWLTTLAFLALLVTGVEILLSHPRFYWGETGNVNTAPLFKLPLPSSRAMVPTGYGYVLPDQNGWSRYLHFQSAWALVLTGLIYLAFGFFKGYFRRNLLPAASELSPRALGSEIVRHLRFVRPSEEEAWSYNVLQRLTYLLVIFALIPLVIWTGLAMSPAVASAIPASVTLLGGQQSARTIHFFLSGFLVLFLLVHVLMVCLAGFRNRVRAMITGRPTTERA